MCFILVLFFLGKLLFNGKFLRNYKNKATGEYITARRENTLYREKVFNFNVINVYHKENKAAFCSAMHISIQCKK